MRSTRFPSIALRSLLLMSGIIALSGPAASSAAYTYDALGRVISVVYSSGKHIVYKYDAAGNRTQYIVSATALNRAPVAVADAVTITEDQASLTFNPRSNDTDPDGNPLTIFSIVGGENGTAAISGGGTSVTYSTSVKRTATDSLTYTINDGQGLESTSDITVTLANLNPVAVNDAVSTVKNVTKNFDPRSNDTDPGNDIFTITAKSTPAHGTLTISGGTALIYVPATNYYGPDSFTYTVTDVDGGAATATVSMSVTFGTQAPIAVNDTKGAHLGFGLTFDPRLNDSDPDGGALTITAKTNGTKGNVVINGGTTLTYTPNSGTSGADSFTYTITDVDGLTATASVSITIFTSNTAPVAVNDGLELYGQYQTGSGGWGTQPTGSIDPRWNDTDAQGDTLTVTSITQPTNGSAVLSGGTQVTVTRTVVCNSPGINVGPVTYTVSDGYGGTATGTISFTKYCELVSGGNPP